jgi:hypothetical protein
LDFGLKLILIQKDNQKAGIFNLTFLPRSKGGLSKASISANHLLLLAERFELTSNEMSKCGGKCKLKHIEYQYPCEYQGSFPFKP